jgi:hypothetical protein
MRVKKQEAATGRKEQYRARSATGNHMETRVSGREQLPGHALNRKVYADSEQSQRGRHFRTEPRHEPAQSGPASPAEPASRQTPA